MDNLLVTNNEELREMKKYLLMGTSKKVQELPSPLKSRRVLSSIITSIHLSENFILIPIQESINTSHSIILTVNLVNWTVPCSEKRLSFDHAKNHSNRSWKILLFCLFQEKKKKNRNKKTQTKKTSWYIQSNTCLNTFLIDPSGDQDLSGLTD